VTCKTEDIHFSEYFTYIYVKCVQHFARFYPSGTTSLKRLCTKGKF